MAAGGDSEAAYAPLVGGPGRSVARKASEPPRAPSGVGEDDDELLPMPPRSITDDLDRRMGSQRRRDLFHSEEGPFWHRSLSFNDPSTRLLRYNTSPTLDDFDAPENVKQIKGRHYTWRYGALSNRPPVVPLEPESRIRRAGEKTFRLLHRISHGSNHQQHKLSIHRIHHISWLYELYVKDIFHTLVNLKLRHLLLLFIFLYLLAFCVLAICFLHINKSCNLGMDNFVEAFAFSVETWLTIGYGVNDPPGPYLRGCPAGVALVTVQGILGLLMNALLVGIVITSVSSGAFRGCTLIFSEKAVIREVAGRLYLMIQVCEMRSTQLLEAHVRAYVIRKPVSNKEVPVDSPQAFELRLIRPDDSNGALMLPVLPSVVVHELDGCSPLVPMPAGGDDEPFKSRHWTRPSTRAADADTGERDLVWCRTCGEQFATEAMLQAHVAYLAEQDALSGATRRHPPPTAEAAAAEADGRPRLESSSAPALVDGAGRRGSGLLSVRSGAIEEPKTWRKQVAAFLDEEWFEILCILEGVDTTTAATVQARHSYVAEDIVWDHTFAPIFTLDPQDGAVIDFTRIHDLVEAPPQPS